MTMNTEVQQALQQLAEIDKVILEESRGDLTQEVQDRFMDYVQQKMGLIEFIMEETGMRPYWTRNGYQLRLR